MPERVLNFRALFLHGLYKMDKPKAYCRLFLPSFLLLSACTVDISQPDPSATAVDAEAKTWAVKFQHQSSFTEQSIKEITAPDLKPGDLLFSSSLGVTSFGIRVFSTSSVSHVAIFLGDNNVAEATGAGVQIVSLKKAMKHSDKLFVLRVPDLTPQQATDITAFANKIKDSGYNYRGIVEFIPFMVTSPDVLTESVLRGFSPTVRQRPGESAVKQCGRRRQKVVVLFGICHGCLCQSRASTYTGAIGLD